MVALKVFPSQLVFGHPSPRGFSYASKKLRLSHDAETSYYYKVIVCPDFIKCDNLDGIEVAPRTVVEWPIGLRIDCVCEGPQSQFLEILVYKDKQLTKQVRMVQVECCVVRTDLESTWTAVTVIGIFLSFWFKWFYILLCVLLSFIIIRKNISQSTAEEKRLRELYSKTV